MHKLVATQLLSSQKVGLRHPTDATLCDVTLAAHVTTVTARHRASPTSVVTSKPPPTPATASHSQRILHFEIVYADTHHLRSIGDDLLTTIYVIKHL